MNFFEGNIFEGHPKTGQEELFFTLLNQENIRIEKIVSTGQTSPVQGWYDQDEAEWVILLQGEAEIEFENSCVKKLSSGDYLFIPPHCRHKVIYTSKTPECIWVAVFIKNVT